jgi:hypothetical protein
LARSHQLRRYGGLFADLAHGNSVVFSDSPSVPEMSIHLSVELQQVRPQKTSPDSLSRNVLPTRFWSRMLGTPGRRRAKCVKQTLCFYLGTMQVATAAFFYM